MKRMIGERSRSLPKFGLLTDPIESVPDEIVRIRDRGFDYVEIGIEEPGAPPGVLLKQKDEILRSISASGIFALGHTAYWVGFGSSHENVRRGWIEEAKEMIHVASQLRITLLNFHFNSRFGRVGATEESRAIFLEKFTSAMKELVQVAASERVNLMLENVPPERGHPLESLDYFSRVMKAVPELGFHLDVGHAFIENRMKGVGDYIDTFADRLVHVHLHDNHGKWDEHLPLGRGKIKIRKVIKFLKEAHYERTITFEVFTSHADAVRSREFFKKQWSKTNA